MNHDLNGSLVSRRRMVSRAHGSWEPSEQTAAISRWERVLVLAKWLESGYI